MATKEHTHNCWNKERCREELSKHIRKLEARHKSLYTYNSACQQVGLNNCTAFN